MKKTFSRLIFLAGVLGLVIWPLLTPAYAHGPICQEIQGAPCSPNGAERSCVDALDWGPGICICTDTLWDCGVSEL